MIENTFRVLATMETEDNPIKILHYKELQVQDNIYKEAVPLSRLIYLTKLMLVLKGKI